MDIHFGISEGNKIVLKRAIRVYGKEQQVDKCIEELSELIQALSKWKQSQVKKTTHAGKEERSVRKISGEYTDVLLCLYQIKKIFNLEVDPANVDEIIAALDKEIDINENGL